MVLILIAIPGRTIMTSTTVIGAFITMIRIKAFYLSYSAVPEPSTYFMVTGLLMLPGYNFIRRFRKKNVDNGVVEDSTESTM